MVESTTESEEERVRTLMGETITETEHSLRRKVEEIMKTPMASITKD